MPPCRRFAPGLTADDAWLGADAVRYTFTAADFHRLLLAGLPAHCHRNPGGRIMLPGVQIVTVTIGPPRRAMPRICGCALLNECGGARVSRSPVACRRGRFWIS